MQNESDKLKTILLGILELTLIGEFQVNNQTLAPEDKTDMIGVLTLEAAKRLGFTADELFGALKNSDDKYTRKANELIARVAIDSKEMKPKALFADAVSASNKTILIGDLAKILKQNGVNIGSVRLFRWLRKHGYLIKRDASDYNMPTQKSMERKLFVVKETVITHSDGHTTISKTPKVTGKGQIYFVNKFLKSSNPDTEQFRKKD